MLAAVVAALLALSLAASQAEEKGLVEQDADRNRVELSMEYKIRPSGTAEKVKLVTLLPKTINNKQEVMTINFSPSPSRIFENDNNRYAEYQFEDVSSPIDITIRADMLIRRYDFSTIRVSSTSSQSDDVLGRFLENEPYLDTQYPAIMKISSHVNGKDEIDTVKRIYDYVLAIMDYKGYVREDIGAIRCLENRAGDCSDYSDLLVALCRAKNIPARTVDGFLTSYSDNNPRHTWTEIYTREFGWIPFDPLLGDLRQASFENLAPHYIYLSDKRNDRVLNNYHFFVCSYSGGTVNVADTYRIEPKRDNEGTVVQSPGQI